ncbi:MAG TPA: S1 RNA-binding domain-containing protein [Polyangiaceae bacterium]|nr:S1 RNA-binding domain-containing protein [Polyangiaceae bacterium]
MAAEENTNPYAPVPAGSTASNGIAPASSGDDASSSTMESAPIPPAEAAPEASSPEQSSPASSKPGEASEVAQSSEPAEAEAEADEADDGAEASEPPAAGEQGEARKAEGEGQGQPKKKRRRRKKKKPAPERPAGEAAARPTRASERAPFHVGEEVFGKVTAVIDTAIMVDLSGKALAIFDRSEMETDDLVPAVGDRFLARVHNDGARGGLVVLTRKPLREEETKPRVEQAAKDGTYVSGLITGVIKGGVEVDIGGLRAFAPASGMDLHPANANFAALLGQQLDFKVLQYEKGGRDVVVTRRPMLEAEAHERRKQALTLLQEGLQMRGVVRTVVEWGVFVALPDAENLEGLVHVSEASHDARVKLAELFKPGEHLDVKIIKIDEKGKIWLSRKALIEDPWAAAKKKYAAGSRHSGKVTRLEKFGAFVELDTNIEGLIHVADLSLTRIEHANELLKDGQDIDVVVQSFDPRTKKIALHPAPPPERANEPQQRVMRNAAVKVEIIKGEAAGVVVRLLGVTGRAARGFIPAGQTGTNRGTDLRKAFKPGSVIDAKIIELDPKRGEPKLSIRELKTDEERKAHREYRQKLKAEGGFGTLGDLLKKKLSVESGE